MNLTKKKLIDETAFEFEEFIKDVSLNVEQNKKDLFERFKKEYKDFGQMKQNTFSLDFILIEIIRLMYLVLIIFVIDFLINYD